MVRAAVERGTPLMNFRVEQSLDSHHTLMVNLVASDVPELPQRWSLDIGDAVQNARAALDYLAYELVALESGGAYYERSQFPIAWEPHEHTARDRETIDRLGDHWMSSASTNPMVGRRMSSVRRSASSATTPIRTSIDCWCP